MYLKLHEHLHKLATAVVRQGDRATVGHIPYNLAPIVSPFLARSFNKAVTEVTGLRVNWGADTDEQNFASHRRPDGCKHTVLVYYVNEFTS